MNDSATSKLKRDKAQREIRENEKKTLKLRQETENKEKKKDNQKKKQSVMFKIFFTSRATSNPSSSQQGSSSSNLRSSKNTSNSSRRAATKSKENKSNLRSSQDTSNSSRRAATKSKENKLPSTPDSTTSTASTTSYGNQGETTVSDFTEEEVDAIDDNSFDCLEPNGSITNKCFVGYKQRTNYRTSTTKRNTSKTEYFIAQVQNVVDKSQYTLQFLERVKFKQYKPYYTLDLNRPEELVNIKENLVLLKPPEFSFEPKVLKQNGRSNDPNLIMKWYFPRCIEETIKSHFEGHT